LGPQNSHLAAKTYETFTAVTPLPSAAGGSRPLRLSSSSSAQQSAPEKASIAHAIYASTTIPSRSSNCAASSPSGGNGKPNATFDLIPVAWASVHECP
jgi:hypothetical protein